MGYWELPAVFSSPRSTSRLQPLLGRAYDRKHLRKRRPLRPPMLTVQVHCGLPEDKDPQKVPWPL